MASKYLEYQIVSVKDASISGELKVHMEFAATETNQVSWLIQDYGMN